jgi:hypothetical protein
VIGRRSTEAARSMPARRSLPAGSKNASPSSPGSRDPAAKCPTSFAAVVSSVTEEIGFRHVGASSTTCCGSNRLSSYSRGVTVDFREV